MIRLAALILIVWAVGVVIMANGGPDHVLASLTLPRVIH